MRTYRSNEHHRVLRVAEGATSREIVRRRARRCCDAYAVCLDAGEMLVVAKNLNRRQRLTVQVRTDGTAAQVDQLTRIRAAVDDYFVEDVVQPVFVFTLA